MANNESENEEQEEKTDYCVVFSGCFKKMREEAELTQGELAEALGISRQSVNAIEKGKSLPSIELAASIAHYFETTIDAFLSFAQREISNEFERINNRDDIKVNNNINHPAQYFPSGIYKENYMNLIPWRSSSLLDDFDQILDEDIFMPVRMPKMTMKTPRVNVYEKGNEVKVEAQIPGLKADDVDIEVGDNFVTLSSKKKEEREEKDKNYYCREVSLESFSRTIGIPKVISEKSKADYEDGILTVSIPKKEIPQKKTIRVKVKSKK